MSGPQFLGSLVSLALIVATVSGMAAHRPSASLSPVLPAASADRATEARPALAPAVMPEPKPAAVVDAESAEGSEMALAPADLARALLGPLAAYPSTTIDLSPDASSIRDLAAQYQIDTSVLAAFNGLSPDAADERLDIPAMTLPVGIIEVSNLKLREDPPPPPVVAYTISPGDTLLEIAIRFGVDPDVLVAANGLASPDVIAAGQELKLTSWSSPAQAAAAASGPAPAAAAQVAAATVTESAAPAVPLGPPAPTTYEVSPGDTVSEIAERFGVDTETIVGTNNLRSADTIRIGDQLTILPVSGVVHTVREGQTLSEIAALYKVDLGPIIDFNYLDDADLITVGKDLLIPGGRPLPLAPTRPASTEYQVSAGDTLSSIAVRFGVSSSAIAAANSLFNPDRLSIGTRLMIPGISGAAQANQQVVTRNLPMFTASAPSASLPVPSSGAGGSVASIAMRFLGSRYAWGGTTPSGFDCSGFVYYVQAQAGYPVSRGLWGQYSAGPHPSRDQLEPGDIVFFQNTYMAGLSHDGIYLGGGQFISAVDERSGVKISSIYDGYWAARWFGATRAT